MEVGKTATKPLAAESTTVQAMDPIIRMRKTLHKHFFTLPGALPRKPSHNQFVVLIDLRADSSSTEFHPYYSEFAANIP
ncbi:unnamed protein product [Schistocephalus solidus]|uniref:Uncharacterized protein n=1 Tax=Schistocephalus solidus TaxID=70667 RepID=A0A183SZE2_SCHSO|nr:unnamed protein product [Schistocephalus solidus]